MTAPLYWRWVQAIRGWYVPQPIGWAWRDVNRLPVIRKDLSREVEGQPRRIDVHRTAPNLTVRVRVEHCS